MLFLCSLIMRNQDTHMYLRRLTARDAIHPRKQTFKLDLHHLNHRNSPMRDTPLEYRAPDFDRTCPPINKTLPRIQPESCH